MFWCELQVDIFWASVPSITCGILPCSPLDQVSPNPKRQHIHHSQQPGSVTHQQARRLSALTATKTFVENKPLLPARAVKGPESLTGSGSETSSPGKCHLKFWKHRLQDFLAQRHIAHPTLSLELKHQSWRSITVLKRVRHLCTFKARVRRRLLTTRYNFPSDNTNLTAPLSNPL